MCTYVDTFADSDIERWEEVKERLSNDFGNAHTHSNLCMNVISISCTSLQFLKINLHHGKKTMFVFLMLLLLSGYVPP